MEGKTLDMFISTCNYLTSLIDEMLSSEVNLPPDAVIIVNKLLSKLFNFMTTLYQKNWASSSGSVDPNMLMCFPQGMPLQKPQPKLSGGNKIQGTSQPVKKYTDLSVKPEANKVKTKVKVEKVSNIPSQGSTPEPSAKKERIFLTSTFLYYVDLIADGSMKPNGIDVYCRVCNEIWTGSWVEHTKQQVHFEKCSHLKDLHLYSCRLCSICIFGSNKIILPYYEYHFSKVHQGRTQHSWEETLVEVLQALDAFQNSNSSSVSSLKDAVKPNKTKTKKKKKPKTDDKFAPPSVEDTLVPKLDKLTTSDNSPEFTEFNRVLSSIKKDFQERAIQKECGYCQLCDIGVTSSLFEWSDHLESHPNTGSEIYCNKCPLRIYGLDHQKFFSLPAHVQLDKLIGVS